MKLWTGTVVVVSVLKKVLVRSVNGIWSVAVECVDEPQL